MDDRGLAKQEESEARSAKSHCEVPLVRQHSPIPHLVLLNLIDRLVHLGHRETFGLRLHPMPRGHVQHLPQHMRTPRRASGNRLHSP